METIAIIFVGAVASWYIKDATNFKSGAFLFSGYVLLGLAYTVAKDSYVFLGCIIGFAVTTLTSLVCVTHYKEKHSKKAYYFLYDGRAEFDIDSAICFDSLGQYESDKAAIEFARKVSVFPDACLVKLDRYGGEIFVCSLMESTA